MHAHRFLNQELGNNIWTTQSKCIHCIHKISDLQNKRVQDQIVLQQCNLLFQPNRLIISVRKGEIYNTCPLFCAAHNSNNLWPWISTPVFLLPHGHLQTKAELSSQKSLEFPFNCESAMSLVLELAGSVYRTAVSLYIINHSFNSFNVLSKWSLKLFGQYSTVQYSMCYLPSQVQCSVNGFL